MITGRRTSGLVAELKVRNHTFVAGVTDKLGGLDEGPDPHELLEAALTACTIITAQMYASRKGMKLESTDVIVQIVSEGEETHISRAVVFRGELSIGERERLTEIINKCPIHKLLQSQIKIATSVAS